MDDGLVSLTLTHDEARLLVSALRQFEPYWPAHLDDASRDRLLEIVRTSVDRMVATLAQVG